MLKLVAAFMLLLSVFFVVIAYTAPSLIAFSYLSAASSLFVAGILVLAVGSMLDRLQSIDRAVTAQFELLDAYRRPQTRLSR
ncbi:hypothetical protein L1787_09225 [Acuticoccus sp. M5D2P5]|uniref:hypothetical protein n=1 Tax=Acuticoccus kalidii TaxID=2910977 RepID=UPI001F38C3B0|nr:hypothetical protein [Acuticoccus kalidii]MCF3933591.1 hypothetical protein [Acuticoccus kalidii]